MARVLLCHQPGQEQPFLDVALSERNLIVLLSKLYTPGSKKCSFLNGDVPDGFSHACFRVEPDDLHYAFPTRDGGPAGPMHPLAEVVLVAVRRAIDDALSSPDGDEPLAALLWAAYPESRPLGASWYAPTSTSTRPQDAGSSDCRRRPSGTAVA